MTAQTFTEPSLFDELPEEPPRSGVTGRLLPRYTDEETIDVPAEILADPDCTCASRDSGTCPVHGAAAPSPHPPPELPDPDPQPVPDPGPQLPPAAELTEGDTGEEEDVGERLFDVDPFDNWRELWVDMPAFNSADETPFDNINVLFSNAEDRRRFLTLLGEDPNRRKSIWFPSVGYLRMSAPPGTASSCEPNRYPVYIISKGRADTRLTANALTRIGIDFKIVVEPQEYDAYAAHIPERQILVLPFSNLGQGSIPARNWVWDHARLSGARRHWILDDNIEDFYRLNNNLKVKVVNENPFTSCEDWVDRYANVPVAGLQYEFFVPRRDKHPPLRLNTRVYSCILIDCELPDEYRWRGRYNEDTDLSLRVLKAGYVTALFYHYLINKVPTMTMKGGNTDELYAQTDDFDGRRAMAESLVEQHPDVARVTFKWGRWQHHVDYTPFARNRLVPVNGTQKPCSTS